MTKIGFRQFYSYSYEDFKKKLEDSVRPNWLHFYIMKEMRMYANLFNRDMRKILINENSKCNYCGTNEKLTIDHIIPISKGGKNEKENVQILCSICNNKKRAN